jgi:hypothetical protein
MLVGWAHCLFIFLARFNELQHEARRVVDGCAAHYTLIISDKRRKDGCSLWLD